jgi:hypothetical protein
MEEKEKREDKPSSIRIYLLTILLILVLLGSAALAYWVFTPYLPKLEPAIIQELAT